MKINVANPATGCQKLFDFDDERKVRIFYDKRMASEVVLDSLGDEWVGYVARIAGGNDKQGFPMMQGVLVNGRVRLLMDHRHKTYRPRRKGERRRKSVRGCIAGPDLAVINLVIVKKGEKELPGLTDKEIPQRLGPKRASKIRKLFNLEKEDDVRKYVVRRTLPKKEGKKQRTKAPKIQRLVTPRVLQHKRRLRAKKIEWAKKSREDAAEYAKLLAKRRKETKSKRHSLISARRSERASTKKSEKKEETTKKVAKAAKPAKTAKAAAAGKTKRTSTPSTPAKKTQPPIKKARVEGGAKVTKPVKAAKVVKAAAKPAKTAKSAAKPAKTVKAAAKPAKVVKAAAKPAKTAKAAAKPAKTAKAATKPAAKPAKVVKTAKPAAAKPAKTAKAAAKPVKTAKAAAKPAKVVKAATKPAAKPVAAKPAKVAAKPVAAKPAKVAAKAATKPAAKPAKTTKAATKPAAKPTKGK